MQDLIGKVVKVKARYWHGIEDESTFHKTGINTLVIEPIDSLAIVLDCSRIFRKIKYTPAQYYTLENESDPATWFGTKDGQEPCLVVSLLPFKWSQRKNQIARIPMDSFELA